MCDARGSCSSRARLARLAPGRGRAFLRGRVSGSLPGTGAHTDLRRSPEAGTTHHLYDRSCSHCILRIPGTRQEGAVRAEPGGRSALAAAPPTIRRLLRPHWQRGCSVSNCDRTHIARLRCCVERGHGVTHSCRTRPGWSCCKPTPRREQGPEHARLCCPGDRSGTERRRRSSARVDSPDAHPLCEVPGGNRPLPAALSVERGPGTPIAPRDAR